MAVLANESQSHRVTLGEGCLVGRGPRCTLRLDDPLASSEHARLRWRGGRWYLRDLGSSNGTVVDGVPLVPGQDHPLKAGAVVHFGNRDVSWRLVDDGAPRACAVLVDGEGQRIFIGDGILALPSDSDPECQVFRTSEGDWVIERGGALEAVEDQQEVTLTCGRWRLELPPLDEVVASTSEAPIPVMWDLEDATLRFTVSHDGEDVELTVVVVSETIELGVRVYNEMLLELARRRLHDAQVHPELDNQEHGWIYADELISRAGVRDDGQLNQHVYHARKQFARSGIHNAAQIIERGRRGRLRLGTARVVIETR